MVDLSEHSQCDPLSIHINIAIKKSAFDWKSAFEHSSTEFPGCSEDGHTVQQLR